MITHMGGALEDLYGQAEERKDKLELGKLTIRLVKPQVGRKRSLTVKSYVSDVTRKPKHMEAKKNAYVQAI